MRVTQLPSQLLNNKKKTNKQYNNKKPANKKLLYLLKLM